MAFKNFFKKVGKWRTSPKPDDSKVCNYSLAADQAQETETTENTQPTEPSIQEPVPIDDPIDSVGISEDTHESVGVVVPFETEQAVEVKANKEEVLSEAFNKLIEKLEGINENLSSQSLRQDDLISKMNDLPEILKTFPESAENQRKLAESISDEIKSRQQKDAEFLKAVEKIPAETGRQTETLDEMNQKLTDSAKVESQLTENFARFNDTLSRLNQNAVKQTNGILQMNETFKASDNYLKEIISKHNSRFTWVFVSSMVVSLISIIILFAGVVLLVKK